VKATEEPNPGSPVERYPSELDMVRAGWRRVRQQPHCPASASVAYICPSCVSHLGLW
jgi:hypothetical protein